MAGNNKKSSKSSKTKSSKSGIDSAAESALAAVKAMPADQQLAALTAQYTELALQQTQLKTQLSTAVSRYEVSEKSKDQLNSDYTKAMLSKGQLESLCRELQKQNKLTKEENLARIREEEEKRRDVSARLNTTLADITGLMQQNTEKNSELRKENQNMAARLNDLVAQYEARQQNVDKVLKQRDLQLQLAEAKLAKAAIEATEERETFLKDKKRMLEELQACQEKITRMSSTEIALRTQLTKYAEQYEQFQNTVQSSNNIMNKFKIEMDAMTKKIKKLEKETISWQTKWQKSNTALMDMLEERSTLLQRLEKLGKQNTKLQQLGRTLQQQLVEERRSHAAPVGNPVSSLSPSEEVSVAALELAEDAEQPAPLELSGDVAQLTPAAAIAVTPQQLEAEESIITAATAQAAPVVPECLNTEPELAVIETMATETSNGGGGDGNDEGAAGDSHEVCTRLTDATCKLGEIESKLAELKTEVLEATSTVQPDNVEKSDKDAASLECVATTRESTIEITEL